MGNTKNVIRGHIKEQFKTDNDIVNGGKSLKDENVKQTSTKTNPDSSQKTSQAIYQNQEQFLIIQQGYLMKPRT